MKCKIITTLVLKVLEVFFFFIHRMPVIMMMIIIDFLLPRKDVCLVSLIAST